MVRKPKKEKPALTTAQQLGALIKSARDIMRKDKGLNGDLDRLPMLTWIMFLKFLDDRERRLEHDAELGRKPYTPAIKHPWRWRDWAPSELLVDNGKLIAFITQDEVELNSGERKQGLFSYLRNLPSENGRDRRALIARVFKDVINRMTSGYLLREVILKVDGIHFNSTDEIHTLGNLYESMLREMRDAAGDAGEFYTPRPVVKFMVAALDPQLGERVLDPACGTGGFLAEVFTHLEPNAQSVELGRTLQENTIYGQEAKSLPYLLAQMNLLLHGLDFPNIEYGNSLTVKITEIGDTDRYDVILTNPPFGGEEEAGIKANFPNDLQTAETALLFLQLIMRRLRRPETGVAGRAGVVVPNGTLFGDGVSARIKEKLLAENNLHTIVRLPNGVFAPYTSIPTNLLFFERAEEPKEDASVGTDKPIEPATKEIWYYELPPPAGRKQFTKTKPIQTDDFAACLEWYQSSPRAENEHAWRVDFKAKHDDARARAQPHWDAAGQAKGAAAAAEIEARQVELLLRELAVNGLPLFQGDGAAKRRAQQERQRVLEARRDACQEEARRQRQIARDEQAAGDAIYWPIYNLDMKNPNAAEDLEHMPPEQLVEDILVKEQRIIELLTELRSQLGAPL